jgi:hypothetical protein
VRHLGDERDVVVDADGAELELARRVQRAADVAREDGRGEPGQYTKFSGVEREQEGNVHFCGEHTSIDFQGYLNGAVETGERAADEVIAALK